MQEFWVTGTLLEVQDFVTINTNNVKGFVFAVAQDPRLFEPF
jgi:hypothetical protein